MKKTTFKFSTLFAFLTILTTGTVFAQDGTITLAPGLAYGGQVEKLGIRIDGYYTINENIRAGAELTYYFPEKSSLMGTELKANFFAIDFNGNYFFYSKDQFSAYGLAGLEFGIMSVKVGGNSDSDTELGLNLGAGAEYAMDFGNLFGELKLTGLAGNYDQLVIGAGVRFKI